MLYVFTLKKLLIMKTIISLFTLTVFAFVSNAQTSSVYIKGGLNIANVSTSSDGRIDDANALASFHVGIMGDAALGKFFSIQPGILFTGKGSKTQSGQTTDANYFKATFNPYYIEVPINFVVKIPLAVKQSSFFVGVGPYAAIGVAGKNKSEGKVLGAAYSSEKNISFSNDDPTTLNEQEGAGFGIMRRFDFGLNGTAGLELDKVLLSLNYGYGLTKIHSVANDDNDKNKHRVLSLSIGFKL
jgi:Outer membrane protein beta-barrel domain